MKKLAAPLVAGLLLAGCRPAVAPAGAGRLLFDARGGTTWRNHVEPVSDPAGGAGRVLRGERVSEEVLKMTFLNEKGFFTVPEGHRGAVVLRLLVRGGRRLRVALAGEGKLKSYYLEAPAAGRWCQLVLPLEHLRGSLSAGERIRDITVWLLPRRKDAALEPGAEMYLDRAVFRAGRPAAGGRPSIPDPRD